MYHVSYTQWCLRGQGRYFTISEYLLWPILKPSKCHTRLPYTLTGHNIFPFFLDYEGRTGMAAIVLKPEQPFNGETLYKHVVDFLPSYAQPRFVRIMVRQSVASYLYLSSVWPENWSRQSWNAGSNLHTVSRIETQKVILVWIIVAIIIMKLRKYSMN